MKRETCLSAKDATSVTRTRPRGWRERNAEAEDEPVKSMSVRYDQTFRIGPEGTLSVLKFGHIVSRGTNNVIRLNGNIVKEP